MIFREGEAQRQVFFNHLPPRRCVFRADCPGFVRVWVGLPSEYAECNQGQDNRNAKDNLELGEHEGAILRARLLGPHKGSSLLRSAWREVVEVHEVVATNLMRSAPGWFEQLRNNVAWQAKRLAGRDP
jgi:hypothetical protein